VLDSVIVSQTGLEFSVYIVSWDVGEHWACQSWACLSAS